MNIIELKNNSNISINLKKKKKKKKKLTKKKKFFK